MNYSHTEAQDRTPLEVRLLYVEIGCGPCPGLYSLNSKDGCRRIQVLPGYFTAGTSIWERQYSR